MSAEISNQIWIEELGAFFISVVFMTIYWCRAKRLPEGGVPSMRVVNQEVRTAWVASVMELPGREIMAVQTLRNSIMAASLMATTAALVMMGVMTLSGEHGKMAEAWSALNTVTLPPMLNNLKIVALQLCLFTSLLNFGMSVRYFAHVAYMLSLPADYRGRWFHPPFVGEVLNKAGAYYGTGLRLFYSVGPLVLWFLGGAVLIIGTLLLVTVLYLTDRAPIATIGSDSDAV